MDSVQPNKKGSRFSSGLFRQSIISGSETSLKMETARIETGWPSDGRAMRANIGMAKIDEATNHPAKTAESFSGRNNKVNEAPINPSPTIATKANIDFAGHFSSGANALVSGYTAWP